MKEKAERLLRQRIEQKRNFCERCLKDKKADQLDGHHPWGQIGEKILIFFLVCRPCHNDIENNKKQARIDGWIKYK